MRLLPFTSLKDEKGIGYSRVHLARLIRAGQFPRPVAVGAGRIAWIEAEIDGWIEARMTAREAA